MRNLSLKYTKIINLSADFNKKRNMMLCKVVSLSTESKDPIRLFCVNIGAIGRCFVRKKAGHLLIKDY